MRFNSIFLLILCVALGACNASKKAGTKRSKYLPKAFSDIAFNMPMSQVANLRDLRSSDLQDEGFRISVYGPMEHPQIEGAGYYFDNEGDKPLYEVIVVYKSEELRDAAAAQLLGPPNFENGKEWRFEQKKGYEIRAWKFKNKLIVTALIPGTEWYDEAHGEE